MGKEDALKKIVDDHIEAVEKQIGERPDRELVTRLYRELWREALEAPPIREYYEDEDGHLVDGLFVFDPITSTKKKVD